jgi:uncharacterized membrane protein YhhN
LGGNQSLESNLTPLRSFTRLAAVLIFTLAILNIASLYAGNRLFVYLTKPATMVAIICLALHRTVLSQSRYGQLVIVGLVCSLLGDVLLMLPSDQFVAGLVSFLVAHLLYISAFRRGIRGFSPVWLALPFYSAGAAIFWVLEPALGSELKLPVLTYLLVILTMAWQSVLRWRALQNKRSLYASVGAVLFVISDLIIAISRFRGRFYLADALIMGTYFVAQWLIALSI